MAGLDPRVLQGQQRSFETVAQLLLAKRQGEADLKQRVEKAEMSAIINLLKDDNIPIAKRKELVNKAFGRLGLEPATEQQFATREQNLVTRETLQDLAGGAQNVNPDDLQQIFGALMGTRGTEDIQFGLKPREAAEIATEEQQLLTEIKDTDAAKALAEQRRSGVKVDAARIKKLQAETTKVGKSLEGKSVTESKKLQNFIKVATEELSTLIQTTQGFKSPIEGKEFRVKKLRKDIEKATKRFAEIAGLTKGLTKVDIAKNIKMLGTMVQQNLLSPDTLRAKLNEMIRNGVPRRFIQEQLAVE